MTLALGSRHTLRPDHRISVSQELVPAGEIRRVRGVRVTSPLWSVAFEMRKARSDEAAVVAFEMAAYNDLVSVAELAAYVDSALWIRQGVARIRELLPDLDENSWSPKEPVMRRTWQGSGSGRAHEPTSRCSTSPGVSSGRRTCSTCGPASTGCTTEALHLAGRRTSRRRRQGGGVPRTRASRA